MSRVCEVTKKSFLSGNNVSHSHRKTRKTFMSNLHTKRFWYAEENRWVSLRVCKKGLKMIEKLGLKAILDKIQGKKRGK